MVIRIQSQFTIYIHDIQYNTMDLTCGKRNAKRRLIDGASKSNKKIGNPTTRPMLDRHVNFPQIALYRA